MDWSEIECALQQIVNSMADVDGVMSSNRQHHMTPHVQGLEWVAENYQSPAIVHMSIEGAYSAAVNSAVQELIQGRQVHVTASAGMHASCMLPFLRRPFVRLVVCVQRVPAGPSAKLPAIAIIVESPFIWKPSGAVYLQ